MNRFSLMIKNPPSSPSPSLLPPTSRMCYLLVMNGRNILRVTIILTPLPPSSRLNDPPLNRHCSHPRCLDGDYPQLSSVECPPSLQHSPQGDDSKRQGIHPSPGPHLNSERKEHQEQRKEKFLHPNTRVRNGFKRSHVRPQGQSGESLLDARIILNAISLTPPPSSSPPSPRLPSSILAFPPLPRPEAGPLTLWHP